MNLIYAINKYNFIGKNNELMYSFKEDMKFFKEKTTGNTLVFGFKTFYEIGKPLPNRKIIVIVDNKRKFKKLDNVIYVSSLDEAINYYNSHKFGELFICGGKTLYDNVLNNHLSCVNKIYETLIDDLAIGSTAINPSKPNYFKPIYLNKKVDIDRISGKTKNLYFRIYENMEKSNWLILKRNI